MLSNPTYFIKYNTMLLDGYWLPNYEVYLHTRASKGGYHDLMHFQIVLNIFFVFVIYVVIGLRDLFYNSSEWYVSRL